MDAALGRKRTRGRPRGSGSEVEVRVQSLDRALEILAIIAKGDGLSLTEIAQAAKMAPSSVYRLLSTMQAHGVVAYADADQSWSIGVETFRMGSAFLRRRKITDTARDIMRDLMVRSGETVNLALGEEGHVVFVSQVETHSPIRAFFRPGTQGPMHASGIGKAILAHLPREIAARTIAAASLEGFTERTLTTSDALHRDLEISLQRGWAIDDEERFIGMRCVAAPIFNEFGEAVAGISVSGPTVRITPERADELGPLVRQAGDAVTRLMGGTPPSAQQAV